MGYIIADSCKKSTPKAMHNENMQIQFIELLRNAIYTFPWGKVAER